MAKSVFISSTSKDLPEHRTAVDKAIRRLGMRPINMDDFGSQPGGASGVSVREVDKGDIFVGIIARRYGYVPDGMDKSVTEQEYDEAVRRNIPRLMYLLDPAYDWPQDRVEADENAQSKLAAFRARIEKNEVRSLFTTPDTLAAQVTADLTKLADKQQRQGRNARWLIGIVAAVVALLLIGVGLLSVLPKEQSATFLLNIGLIAASATPTATPLAGEPAKQGEIVVLVAQFEQTSGAAYTPGVDILEVLQDEAANIHNVRIISINYPINSPDEAEDVSNTYQATMIVYGRSAPGGVTAHYEITPRFSQIDYNVSGMIRAAASEIRDFDTFLYEGMDVNYILGLSAGQLAYFSDDYQMAVDAFSLAAESLRRHPDRADDLAAYILYDYRGEAYYNQGKLDDALADYSTAIRLNPDYANAHNNRGLVYYDRNMLDAALTDYNTAIQLDQDFDIAYNNRGLVRYKQGDPDSALADYNTAIRLNPNAAIAYDNRGFIRFHKDDWEGGIADYDIAIQLKPDLSIAYYHLSYAYYTLGDYTKAFTDISKYLSMKPDDTDAVESRAEIHFALGQYENALADFQTYANTKPDDRFTLSGLAISYHALGDTQQAQQFWTQLLEIDTRYNDVDWLKSELFWAEPLVDEARKIIAEMQTEVTPQATP